MVARIAMLLVVLALARLTEPLVYHFSVRDLVLLAGGLFLIYKAVREIHHGVELLQMRYQYNRRKLGGDTGG